MRACALLLPQNGQWATGVVLGAASRSEDRAGGSRGGGRKARARQQDGGLLTSKRAGVVWMQRATTDATALNLSPPVEVWWVSAAVRLLLGMCGVVVGLVVGVPMLIMTMSCLRTKLLYYIYGTQASPLDCPLIKFFNSLGSLCWGLVEEEFGQIIFQWRLILWRVKTTLGWNAARPLCPWEQGRMDKGELLLGGRDSDDAGDGDSLVSAVHSQLAAVKDTDVWLLRSMAEVQFVHPLGEVRTRELPVPCEHRHPPGSMHSPWRFSSPGLTT
jgi:hypothetical protein